MCCCFFLSVFFFFWVEWSRYKMLGDAAFRCFDLFILHFALFLFVFCFVFFVSSMMIFLWIIFISFIWLCAHSLVCSGSHNDTKMYIWWHLLLFYSEICKRHTYEWVFSFWYLFIDILRFYFCFSDFAAKSSWRWDGLAFSL